MTALKKKSETCEEQLRRMCKNIANSISEPQEITAIVIVTGKQRS